MRWWKKVVLPKNYWSIVGGVVLTSIFLTIGLSKIAEKQTLGTINVVETMALPKEITLLTNMGNIVIALRMETPESRKIIGYLVRRGYYDGTRVNRVVKDFLIEMGDPISRDIRQKARWGEGGGLQFADEIFESDKLERGAVVFVNHGKDTNDGRFFILTKTADFFNGDYTWFGQVTTGMEVVDTIAALPIGVTGIPQKEIVINRIVVTKTD